MSGGRWFSGELKAGAVVVGRVVLGCISMLAGLFAAFDCFWSEGRLSSYGQLRPWPFLIPVAIVAGWLAARGFPHWEPKSNGEKASKDRNL